MSTSASIAASPSGRPDSSSTVTTRSARARGGNAVLSKYRHTATSSGAGSSTASALPIARPARPTIW